MKLAGMKSATAGSAWLMPGARSESGSVTTWTAPDTTSMNTWQTNNGTKSATFLWWEKAALLTTALDAFYALDAKTKLDKGTATAAIKREVDSSKKCDVSDAAW